MSTPDFAALCDRASLTQRVLDEAQEYLRNSPPGGDLGMTLDWTWGRSDRMGGYLELKSRVRDLVKPQLAELCATAFGQLQREAAEAREALAAYLEEAQREPPHLRPG